MPTRSTYDAIPDEPLGCLDLRLATRTFPVVQQAYRPGRGMHQGSVLVRATEAGGVTCPSTTWGPPPGPRYFFCTGPGSQYLTYVRTPRTLVLVWEVDRW